MMYIPGLLHVSPTQTVLLSVLRSMRALRALHLLQTRLAFTFMHLLTCVMPAVRLCHAFVPYNVTSL